jgi:hypothetical protein
MFNHLSKFYWQLFKNDYLRYLLVYIRYLFYRLFYKFEEISSPYSISNSNSYNRSALNSIRTECFYNRIKYLHGILMSLEYISKNSNILLIGSRSENELIYLKSYGFINITCVDILSYSPTIKCMDMHNLKFKNNKFDIIICGWTLVYSQNQKKCANELVRVTKDNGIVAIGYAKLKKKNKVSIKAKNESLIIPKENANSAKEILQLFARNIKKKIFIYDGELNFFTEKKIYKLAGHTSSNILTIFKIKK